MARVLFYLPVVTPWWFDHMISPLIGALATETEVHVVVPPLWRNTGVGPAQVEGCSSIHGVEWHIVNDPDHRSLRTYPADSDGVVEFVQKIAPDYVFCRSADIATPSRFPGKIVHLLESGASPFALPLDGMILQRDFWHHGAMPVLSDEDRESLDAAFATTWERMQNRLENEPPFCLPRDQVLKQMGLPEGRKIIALPLEYEHEEAFTGFHNRFARNLDLIDHVAEAIDDEFVLAIADHPLNYKHVDNRLVHSAIRALGSRAQLVPNAGARYLPTTLLIKNCDGLVVQNTKALYAGAFFGKPTLRLSHRPTADWIGVHGEITPFLSDVRAGRAGASVNQARTWFAFHVMHEVIAPAKIEAAEILDRVERPFSRDRLQSGLERFEAYQSEVDWAA
ncbi:hypothetical protein LQ953_10570 [Sphingomonas sp. IC-56]|uniref:hypothetical protein n=1 Tax=Sphingomonas sp. IC-56 TaxID=2898529 RepID=UPI001E6523E2|nr:hypothetical protein [Sphingomonas sp. IC-56]MCD2324457.1 hypothetical protein [Sphingomonas sp. IC-56]